MKLGLRCVIVVIFCGWSTVSIAQPSEDKDLRLWYRQPATQWTDALPIGNGHIGAMIYGNADTEHIQFNEATLWTDGPREYQHPGAFRYLDTIRALLFHGKQKQAEEIATDHFMGVKNHDPVQYEIKRKAWLGLVGKDTSFANCDYNDAGWKTMTIPLMNGWESDGLQGLDGSVWFRASFVLPKQWEGKNVYVDLGRIRDADYTYINGKLIGSNEGISTKRHYLIAASLLKSGKNTIAVQVINYFDKGGFTGVKSNHRILVVYPVNTLPENGLALSQDWKYFIQNDNPPPYPQYEASYQPFGDVYFRFKNQAPIQDYSRYLDISKAVAGVDYQCGELSYHREYWASAAGDFMAIRFTASKRQSVNFSAWLSSVHKSFSVTKIDDNTLSLRVNVTNGALHGVSYLYAKVKGSAAKIKIEHGILTIAKADTAILYLSAATNFKSYRDVSGDPDILCSQGLQPVKQNTYTALKKAHEKKYLSCFNRFYIDFGQKNLSTVPTDERIRRYNHYEDPALIALYVQYARYLLVSCSPYDAHVPANLQGIWNDLLTPPWGSKYTTNINLEMNYWPAEELNLSDCTQPLFNLIKNISRTGQLTAKAHYNAPGWIEHHNTDIWAATAPIDAATNGIWVTGSAWLCHHLWEHYLFTKDVLFLKDTAYPVMKSAARFYAYFLVKDPVTGYLISTPSNSPEHGGLVSGPTMDHQIIRDLFKNCIEAESLLGIDQLLCDTLRNMYGRIAPNEIGKYGQLQEWMTDTDDTSDTHRHVSHLWGVYPGTDIVWDKDSAMMRAARQSLIFRGDGGTGWSLAWKVNLWDRFRDGDHALKLIDELLRPAENASGSERGGVYRNMFDAHPPFQIDGNFGGAAGVAEMLVQSQQGYIDILPALPSALSDGDIKGICARGGFVLDFSWRNSRLTRLIVHSNAGSVCILRYGARQISLPTKKGGIYIFDEQLRRR